MLQKNLNKLFGQLNIFIYWATVPRFSQSRTQLKWLSMHIYIYIYMQILFSLNKKENSDTFYNMRMNLEVITLGKTSWSQKDRHCMIPLIWDTSVQFSSVTQSCLTLCNPMNCSMSGLPVYHQLPEFTQTHVHWVNDAIQPSHPLSSPSPPAQSPPASGSFQWVNSLHQVAKVLEFQLQQQSFQWTPRTDLL